MKTTRPETKYRAPALEKGLDILELLSSIDTPIAMPQIAAELNRSKGSRFPSLAPIRPEPGGPHAQVDRAQHQRDPRDLQSRQHLRQQDPRQERRDNRLDQ